MTAPSRRSIRACLVGFVAALGPWALFQIVPMDADLLIVLVVPFALLIRSWKREGHRVALSLGAFFVVGAMLSFGFQFIAWRAFADWNFARQYRAHPVILR